LIAAPGWSQAERTKFGVFELNAFSQDRLYAAGELKRNAEEH